MMKEWYIVIEGESEGPFSLDDLKKDKRITPETLVWKEGFKTWIPIGKVAELKSVFSDQQQEEEEEDDGEDGELPPEDGELTLRLREDPPSDFWLIIFLMICLFIYLVLCYYYF